MCKDLNPCRMLHQGAICWINGQLPPQNRLNCWLLVFVLVKGRKSHNALQKERQRGGKGAEQKGPGESKNEEAIAHLLIVYLQWILTNQQPSNAGAEEAAEVRGRQQKEQRPRGAGLDNWLFAVDLIFSSAAWCRFAGLCRPMARSPWGFGSTEIRRASLSRPSTLSCSEHKESTSFLAKGSAVTPRSAKTTGTVVKRSPWCVCCNWSTLLKC